MLIIKGCTCEQQERLKDFILYPSDTFNAYCQDDWVDSSFGRAIISDIDRIDVFDTALSTKEILLREGIRLCDIATGTKNLFLCKYYTEDKPVYNRMGFMGENCFKWLLDIAAEKDVYMVTTVYRKFKQSDFRVPCEVYFEDLCRSAHNADEVREAMLELNCKHYLEA